jgi:ferredoxin
MRVVVDVNLCNLHGLCMETAPEVFKIGDDAKVDKAVRECPTGAISIEQ